MISSLCLCDLCERPFPYNTHYALRIKKTGLEDMSAADKTFVLIASSLLALGAALILLRRMRKRVEVRYYRRG